MVEELGDGNTSSGVVGADSVGDGDGNSGDGDVWDGRDSFGVLLGAGWGTSLAGDSVGSGDSVVFSDGLGDADAEALGDPDGLWFLYTTTGT